MTTDILRGRTALVTGGSRGIGAAISRALAEAGAAVAINYRERADTAAKLAEDLTGQTVAMSGGMAFN
jgi:3-oxoacyl-[acyl-carrier protein] reductase